jgi:hypothetical protein
MVMRREKGEGRREKGEGRREKGEGRRLELNPRFELDGSFHISEATDQPVCCDALLGSDLLLTEFLAPASARLACAKLFFELTARVGGKKLARVKPVFGTGEGEDSWDSSREVGVFWAAEVPEC